LQAKEKGIIRKPLKIPLFMVRIAVFELHLLFDLKSKENSS